MPVTAGEFGDWLQQFPRDTPIVIDVNTDEGVYLHVDELLYTSDEGGEEGKVQIELYWEPEPGWVKRLLESANEVRKGLGLPPLE